MVTEEEIRKEEKQKVAYALNLWTVSVSQIVHYNDVNIMEQEYNSILNNLNIECMPKDDALLDIITKILDVITFFRISDGDRDIIDREYQHRMKNAIWTAIPNVGAIFATKEAIPMVVTLATQVGIGYMNYRKNKAEYELRNEKEKWHLKRNAIDQLNALQKELFQTAWRLAEKHNYPEVYRLTDNQINKYNEVLMEVNPIKRYNGLNFIKDQFEAFPPFWYQMGSAANSVYRDSENGNDPEFISAYKNRAIKCFEKYKEKNRFNLLRHDPLTSSWALEYLDLLDLTKEEDKKKAIELIDIAYKYSGNENDILELCGFAKLKVHDYEGAEVLFKQLVNQDYNTSINSQILSCLYIKEMESKDSEKALEARIGYKELEKTVDNTYIIPIPEGGKKVDDLLWNKDNSGSPLLEYQSVKDTLESAEQEANEERRQLNKACEFYRKPITIVYNKLQGDEDAAEFFLNFLNTQKSKLPEIKSLSSPIKLSIKEYEEGHVDIEKAGGTILFVGASPVAKKVYANGKVKDWDFNCYGMKFITKGNKTVFIVDPLKNKQITPFINYVEDFFKKHRNVEISVPSNVKTAEGSFLGEIYNDYIKYGDASDYIAVAIASPLVLLGEGLQHLANGLQRIDNAREKEKLRLLQYIVALLNYLDSVSAFIHSD